MDAVVFLRDVPLEPVSVDLIPHLVHILRLAGHRVRWQPDPGCLFVDSPLEGKTISGKACGEENGIAAQTLAELFRWVRMAGGVALSTPTHRTDVQIRIFTEPCEKGDLPSILVISGRKRWFSFRPTLAEMVADSLRGAVDLPVGILTERSSKSTEVEIRLRAPLDDEIPRAVARAIWLALMARFSARQKGTQPSPSAALQAMGLVDRPPERLADGAADRSTDRTASRVRPEPVPLENRRKEKAGSGKEPAATAAGAASSRVEEVSAPAAAREAGIGDRSEAALPNQAARRRSGRSRHRQLPDPALGVRPRVVWESEGPDPFPYTVEGAGPGVGWLPELAGSAVPSEPARPPREIPSDVSALPDLEVFAASPAPSETAALARAAAAGDAGPANTAAATPGATSHAGPAMAAAAAAETFTHAEPPMAAAAAPEALTPAGPAATSSAASSPTSTGAAPVTPPFTAPAHAASGAPATPTPVESVVPIAAVPAGTTAESAAHTALPTPAAVSTHGVPSAAPAVTPSAPAAHDASAEAPAVTPVGPAEPPAPAAAASSGSSAVPSTAGTPALGAAPPLAAAAAPASPDLAAASAAAPFTPAAVPAAADRGTAHLTSVQSDGDIEQRSPGPSERLAEAKAAGIAPESTRVAVAIEAQTYRFSPASKSAYKVIHH